MKDEMGSHCNFPSNSFHRELLGQAVNQTGDTDFFTAVATQCTPNCGAVNLEIEALASNQGTRMQEQSTC